jgi:EpsI family protein
LGGAWEQLDGAVLEALGPSSYVARLYEAPDQTPIGLYVGFYAGRAGHSKAAHDPEICFPAAGWETLATRSVRVSLPEGDTIQAQLLDTHRGTARRLVLHWIQPAARWPRGVLTEELTYVLDAISGRPQYAFVRLVADVPDAAAYSAVYQDLIAFASEVAWPVRAALSADPDAQPTVPAERGAPRVAEHASARGL